ncbi:MAG: hypothetical protein ACJ76Z_13350 [Thermoleophilaceae bacterium]
MPYPVRNALYQWEDGDRRLRDVDGPDRRRLDRGVELILDELRRRLGSTFTVEELADYYGEGTSWADDLAGTSSWLIDAAFNRYAREAKNYAGGKPRALNESV